MIVLPIWPSRRSRLRISIRARGVEAAERFVEQQNLRIVKDRASQAQPLRLAARERVRIGVALEVEIDDFEHLVASSAPLRAANPISRRKELQILDHLHVVVHAKEVGHVADEPANLLGLGIDRIAADVRFAPGRVEQRGDDPHRRGLARAVGTDEAEAIPLVQREIDVSDGERVAVLLGQPFGFDRDF